MRMRFIRQASKVPLEESKILMLGRGVGLAFGMLSRSEGILVQKGGKISVSLLLKPDQKVN